MVLNLLSKGVKTYIIFESLATIRRSLGNTYLLLRMVSQLQPTIEGMSTILIGKATQLSHQAISRVSWKKQGRRKERYISSGLI